MKKIFFIFILSFSFSVYGQQAGQAGTLQKNELAESDKVLRNSKMQNRRIDNLEVSHGQKRNFYWKRNYGTGEIFLRIPENGNFTIEVQNQSISNATGKFRFFDLKEGIHPIFIYENGHLLYRSSVRITNNFRIIADFFTQEGLYILDVVPTNVQIYGNDINYWDDIWNNPYQNPNLNHLDPNANSDILLNNNEFSEFLNLLNKNSNFDDDKTRIIKQQSMVSMFTSSQILMILKSYLSDDKRLEAAKILAPRCVDFKRFFIVMEAFNFESNRRKLQEYLSK